MFGVRLWKIVMNWAEAQIALHMALGAICVICSYHPAMGLETAAGAGTEGKKSAPGPPMHNCHSLKCICPAAAMQQHHHHHHDFIKQKRVELGFTTTSQSTLTTLSNMISG